MDRPQSLPADDLRRARTCFGLGTIAWSHAGGLRVEEDWWLALSGTPHVDYNLALLHGPAALDAATHVIDTIGEAGVPAVIMLAGAGLGAVGTLSEAGWVCTGTLPFMERASGPCVDDPAVRLLEPRELADARALVVTAFGVPDEVGAIVYTEEALARPDTLAWGLFEDGALRCCSLSVWVRDAYSVGWALATAPDRQRSGYGRRLMRATNYHRRRLGGPPGALLTASPAGERLYGEEGYATLEHWQVWSRPRWILR